MHELSIGDMTLQHDAGNIRSQGKDISRLVKHLLGRAVVRT